MSAAKQQRAPKVSAHIGSGTFKAKPKPLDVAAACKDVMARFPKVLARLAE